MEERRRRLLRPGRLIERLLRAHGGSAENRGAALLAILGGCLLDPLNDGFDPRTDLLRRQVLPTGKGPSGMKRMLLGMAGNGEIKERAVAGALKSTGGDDLSADRRSRVLADPAARAVGSGVELSVHRDAGDDLARAVPDLVEGHRQGAEKAVRVPLRDADVEVRLAAAAARPSLASALNEPRWHPPFPNSAPAKPSPASPFRRSMDLVGLR